VAQQDNNIIQISHTFHHWYTSTVLRIPRPTHMLMRALSGVLHIAYNNEIKEAVLSLSLSLSLYLSLSLSLSLSLTYIYYTNMYTA